MSAIIISELGKLKRDVRKVKTADARKIVRNFVLGLEGALDGPLLEDYLQDSVNRAGWNVVLGTPEDINMIAELALPFDAVVASQTARDSVFASKTAMDSVVASQTAMDAITASQTAMDSLNKSSIAIAKYITSLAGLDHTQFRDMDDVIASQTVMDAVFSSATATESFWAFGSEYLTYGSAARNSSELSIGTADDAKFGGRIMRVYVKSSSNIQPAFEGWEVGEFDLTDVDTLSIWTRFTDIGNNNRDNRFPLTVRVGGQEVLSRRLHNWELNEISVVNFSGPTVIHIGSFQNGSIADEWEHRFGKMWFSGGAA